MNKEFVENLKSVITNRIDEMDGVTGIDVQEVVKNNNNVLTGLVFKNESDVAPIIYVDKAYAQFEAGKSLDDIASEIISTYKESMYHGPSDSSDFLNYDKIKDKLYVCALNEETNREMLKEIPHQKVADVALIARIEVSSDSEGIGTVKVNDQLLEAYGISEDELFEQAWSNMKEIHPVVCKDMVDIFKELNPGLPEDIMGDHRGEMYVVQTANQMHGASYGFDKETLNNICEKIESPNVYILPSSINEVIIVPEEKVDDPDQLVSIVAHVNDESVPPEDVLSNSAYFYNSETQDLTIVTAEPEMSMDM